MRKLLRHIIIIGSIILISGISYHLLTLRQTGETIEWQDVGEGGRETVDVTKEIYDSTKVKVFEVWDEIEEGYDKKDSL